jgi:hypothetical protein
VEQSPPDVHGVPADHVWPCGYQAVRVPKVDSPCGPPRPHDERAAGANEDQPPARRGTSGPGSRHGRSRCATRPHPIPTRMGSGSGKFRSLVAHLTDQFSRCIRRVIHELTCQPPPPHRAGAAHTVAV